MSPLNTAALALFAVCWLFYQPLLILLGRRGGAVINTDLMVVRAAWMHNMARRDGRFMDGQLLAESDRTIEVARAAGTESATAAAAPGARTALIRGAGHSPNVEKPLALSTGQNQQLRVSGQHLPDCILEFAARFHTLLHFLNRL